MEINTIVNQSHEAGAELSWPLYQITGNVHHNHLIRIQPFTYHSAWPLFLIHDATCYSKSCNANFAAGPPLLCLTQADAGVHLLHAVNWRIPTSHRTYISNVIWQRTVHSSLDACRKMTPWRLCSELVYFTALYQLHISWDMTDVPHWPNHLSCV